MMPLTMAKAGETATIHKISGKDEVRQHLAELGFVVDSDAGEGQPHCAGQNDGNPHYDLRIKRRRAR